MSKKDNKKNIKENNIKENTTQKNVSKKNNKKGNSKKESSNPIPKTVTDSIPYLNVYSNGIIEVDKGKFSKSYKLPEANFVALGDKEQEDLATLYSDFLCSFDPDVNIQITMYNRTIDMDQFNNDVLLPMKSDGRDQYREEYNNMIVKKMKEAKNNLVTDKYLTLTINVADVFEATERFDNIDSMVNDNIAAMTKKTVKPMSIEDRLELLNIIYNQDDAFSIFNKKSINGKEISAFSLENCAKQGITTKDVITPSSLSFKSRSIEIGKYVAKTYFINSYPTWIKGTILTDFADLSTNALVSVYFTPIEQDAAIKYVRKQGVNVSSRIVDVQKKSALKGIDADLISPADQDAKDEIRELLDSMTRDNVKLFKTTFLITLFAENNDELENYETQLKMIVNKHLLSMKVMDYQQEDGFNSSLPIGNKKTSAEILMTSLSIASIIPFKTKELNQNRGIYYGLNACSRGLIIYNRASDDINPNGCILGMPGSGKSFSAKEELITVLLNTDDEVYCIDPENEFVPIAKALDGSVVKISNSAKNHINPFDMNIENTGEDKDPLKTKSAFIEGIVEVMIGRKLGLSPAQESIIDRVTADIYEDYISNLQKTGKKQDIKEAPTLVDFYEELLRQPNPEAVDMALALEKYVKGSANIFSHHSNVDIENRFTIFSLKEATGTLKDLALSISFDYIWNKMMENFEKGKRTWIYIDEFYLMMKNASSAEYISQIWKRARKWNGVPCAITQNVEDMLNSPEARTVINNCSFITLLRQSSINKMQLSDMLGISKSEQKYISSPKAGTGLIIVNEEAIPFTNEFPADTELYKIMTTKPEERL